MNRKLFALLFCMIFLVGTIAAFEFDNVRSYDAQNKEVTIKNAFGLGNDIAKLKLDTNLNENVAPGYGRVAEITVTGYGFYQNALRQIEFYDANNMNSIERGFDLKYKVEELVDVADYGMVCSQGQNGTDCQKEIVGSHQELREIWKPITGPDMQQGEMTIGIFTEVQAGDYVEWIPTFYGERITEWATWTSNLNVGLVSYFKFDVGNTESIIGQDIVNDTSTTANNATNFVINRSASFDGGTRISMTNASYDFSLLNETSVSFWIYWEGGGDPASHRIISSGSNGATWDMQIDPTDSSIYVGGNLCGELNTGASKIEQDNWTHFAATCNTTTVRWYKDGAQIAQSSGSFTLTPETTLTIGANNFITNRFLTGGLDEFGIWNRTLTSAEVTNIYNSGAGITYSEIFDLEPTFTLNAPINYFNSSSVNITFNYTAQDDVNVTNVTLYIDGILNITTTQGASNFSNIETVLNFTEGAHNWSVSASDNATPAQEPSSAVQFFTIDSLDPFVNLSKPRGQIDSHIIGNPLDVNWTFIEVNPGSCWIEYNAVNNTVTCADLNGTITTVDGVQTLNFYMNDSGGNVGMNTTSWTYSVTEAGKVFNLTVEETSQQDLITNVSTELPILSATAFLDYNGTIYPSTVTCAASCIIENTIDINLLTPEAASQNKTFFWNVTFTTSSETDNIMTSLNSHNVTAVNFNNCSALSEDYINFSIYDALAPTNLINSTFQSNWEFWLGSGTVKKNISYQDTSETFSNFTFCSNINNTLNTNAEIQFDAAGYAQNSFHFFEEPLTNGTNEQKLYLLEDGNATLTVLRVVNNLQQGLENRLIEYYIRDIGTGIDTLVGIAKTDHNGEDIVFLNWIDSQYKFRILLNGTLEIEVDPYKVGSTPQVFKLGSSIIFESDTFDDVTWNLFFNSSSNEFVVIYNDLAGEISGGCLRVVKGGATNYTMLSDQCLTTTSGTISYNIGTNQTGGYLGVFYAKGSVPQIFETLYKFLEAQNTIYSLIGNLDGSILTFIIVGTATFLGILIGPAIGILFMLLGYLAATVLGYQNLAVANLLSFLIVAGIGIYLMLKLQK